MTQMRPFSLPPAKCAGHFWGARCCPCNMCVTSMETANCACYYLLAIRDAVCKKRQKELVLKQRYERNQGRKRTSHYFFQEADRQERGGVSCRVTDWPQSSRHRGKHETLGDKRSIYLRGTKYFGVQVQTIGRTCVVDWIPFT